MIVSFQHADRSETRFNVDGMGVYMIPQGGDDWLPQTITDLQAYLLRWIDQAAFGAVANR